MAYGLFADIFTSTEKKVAVQELEDAKIDYQLAEKRLKSAAEELFITRKKALITIEKTESKLKRRRDFSIENVTKIAVARASIRDFTEIIQNESKLPIDANYSENRNNLALGTSIGVIGAIGGGVLRSVGTRAFGSALGSATLGMGLFPLLGIASMGAAAYYSFKSFNNDDELNNIKKQKKEIDSYTDKIIKCTSDIISLKKVIEQETDKVNNLLDNGATSYHEIVETIKILCVNINKRFDI